MPCNWMQEVGSQRQIRTSYIGEDYKIIPCEIKMKVGNQNVLFFSCFEFFEEKAYKIKFRFGVCAL
jgi:hypothetical protein